MALRHSTRSLASVAALVTMVAMGGGSAFAASVSVTDPPIHLGNISSPSAPPGCLGMSGWYCHVAGVPSVGPGWWSGPAGNGGGQGGAGSSSGGTGAAGSGATGGSGMTGTAGKPTAGSGTTGGSAGTSNTSGSAAVTGTGGSAAVTSQDAQVLSLVNQARTAAGLNALVINPTLQTLALKKANDMVTLGYFGHVSPDLGLPGQMETQAGYIAQAMGAEDIAEAGSVIQAWAEFRASPPHWANIMYPSFTQIGIAVVPDGSSLIVEVLFSGNPM